MDANIFGTFLARCRKEMNMTQAELAMKLSVTDKAVSRWERGIGFPDISTIVPLANTLNVGVHEIMKAEKDRKEGWHVTDGYFRPHTVLLTKEGMAQLPEPMRKHAEEGGKLWQVTEPVDGKTSIAMSKTDEGVYVNASYVVCKLRINPDVIPFLPERERKHRENGGFMYVVGEPLNGRILVSDSPELDGYVEMENHYYFAETINTDYSDIAYAMKECVDIIRRKMDDKHANDRKESFAATLYNYLKYCLTVPDLDELTALYRNKEEDNVIGYNPSAVAYFVGSMLKRYPKE